MSVKSGTGKSSEIEDCVCVCVYTYVSYKYFLVDATDCLCPSEVHALQSSPQCEVLRRWGLWEVVGQEAGARVKGISALIRETPPSRR